jgi:hypothetical protein
MRKLVFIASALIPTVGISPVWAQPTDEATQNAAAGLQEQLREADAAYASSRAAAAQSLLEAIDKRFNAAAEKGDLDAAKRLTAAREAFEKFSKLPTDQTLRTAAKSYELAMEKARARRRATYDDVIKAYTKAKDLESAEAVRKARDVVREFKAAADATAASKPEKLISGKATYLASSQFESYAALPALLTGEGRLHANDGFAFHTADGAPGSIIIDLGKPSAISRIWIENRRRDGLDRAIGMEVRATNDPGKDSKLLWTATAIEKEYTVQLPREERARYIIIRNPKPQPLHLARVKIFAPADE